MAVEILPSGWLEPSPALTGSQRFLQRNGSRASGNLTHHYFVLRQ
ncbi:MAG: hypothetical protein ABIN45_06300 [Gammaproteobacteria bacterium]